MSWLLNQYHQNHIIILTNCFSFSSKPSQNGPSASAECIESSKRVSIKYRQRCCCCFNPCSRTGNETGAKAILSKASEAMRQSSSEVAWDSSGRALGWIEDWCYIEDWEKAPGYSVDRFSQVEVENSGEQIEDNHRRACEIQQSKLLTNQEDGQKHTSPWSWSPSRSSLLLLHPRLRLNHWRSLGSALEVSKYCFSLAISQMKNFRQMKMKHMYTVQASEGKSST